MENMTYATFKEMSSMISNVLCSPLLCTNLSIKEQLQAHLTTDWRLGKHPCTTHTHSLSLKILLSYYITLICQRAPSAFHWGFLLSFPLSSSSLSLCSCFSSNNLPPPLTVLPPQFHPSSPPLLIKQAHLLFSNLHHHRLNQALTKHKPKPQYHFF